MHGFWDYGPLGVALKNNIRDAWWSRMVERSPIGPDGRPLQVFGLDSSIILNPSVWKASGHTDGFDDDLVDCRESKGRYRADHLLCVPVAALAGQSPGWVAVIDGDDLHDRLRKRIGEISKRFSLDTSFPFDLATAIRYSDL